VPSPYRLDKSSVVVPWNVTVNVKNYSELIEKKKVDFSCQPFSDSYLT
jgi:hypothetical protein